MAATKGVPAREALIQQAAKEAAALNPHIQAPLVPYTDEEYAALQAEWEHYDREVAGPLGEQAQAKDYYASDAVNDDRGE
jgi:hypothetical protein